MNREILLSELAEIKREIEKRLLPGKRAGKNYLLTSKHSIETRLQILNVIEKGSIK